jgi:succinate dehydrogenase/fumarate reductase flavoprotein subunit
MQKAMDLYAGGRSSGYRYSREGLKEAASRILEIWRLSGMLKAESPRELSRVWELRERLTVAVALVSHLAERSETRWPGFGEYADYPDVDDSLLEFIDSRLEGTPVFSPEDLAKHPPVMSRRPLDSPDFSAQDPAKPDLSSSGKSSGKYSGCA